MRIGLAIRVFFSVLWDATTARAVQEALDRLRSGVPAEPSRAAQRRQVVETVVDTPRCRSDALSLLATLQREARLIDMIKEPLGNYSDAQVGAAARDVLRDCGRVLDRLFDLRPVVDQEEGSDVEVPAGYDTGRYRLTGNVGGTPPFRGRLVHHGWLAARCELPTWSGSTASQMIVAPEEVAVA
jgi:hypothetical protein